MFIDRIKEEKARLGITTRAMAEASKLHITEETMSRFLNGKISDPHVSTLVDIGDTVGLAPYELFMDAVTAREFREYLTAKIKNIDNAAELELLRIRSAEIEHKNAELAAENTRFKEQKIYYEEVIKLKSELIDSLRSK